VTAGQETGDVIAISQSRAGDLATEFHVVELALQGAQTSFDVAQTFSISQLCERHGEKLIPTRISEILYEADARSTGRRQSGRRSWAIVATLQKHQNTTRTLNLGQIELQSFPVSAAGKTIGISSLGRRSQFFSGQY